MDYMVFFLVFLAGILTKFTDLIVDDGLKTFRYVEYLTAAGYGLILGYIMLNYHLLASLGLALILAVLVSKKIGISPHTLGVLVSLLLLGLFGFPEINHIFFIVFLIAGVVDEFGNDFADKGKIKGPVKWFFKFRLSMEIVTLGVSFVTGLWIFFFAMLSYDIGYNLTGKIGKRFL